MIKSLMVCTDGSDGSQVAVDYALGLAGRIRASVSALHVLDTRLLEGPFLADLSGWLGAQPFAGQVPQFRTLLEERGKTILDAFRKQAEAAGFEPDVRLKTGHPARVILAEEARTELVVLGRTGEHAEQGGGFPGSTVERVLRHSIKPCLVVPRPTPEIRRILAAFDGSVLSSKALQQAIELALALGAPLVLLTVCEGHDTAGARQITEDGMRMVRAHECAAANLVVSGESGAEIMHRAESLGCDLIVMSAYGEGLLREVILGSTTSNVLASSPIPLLLVR